MLRKWEQIFRCLVNLEEAFAIIWFCFARWNQEELCFFEVLLKLFGAKIVGSVNVYPSAKIWDPINLTMYNGSCIDNDVFVYNVAMVSIGERSVISREAKLCTATHDYNTDSFDLKIKPINIMNDAWICMDVFVAPGVNVGSFGVALARSVVLNDISNYEVYLGNPAKCVRIRKKLKRN